MGFSKQEYWSGVPLPSPKDQHRDIEKIISYIWRCPFLHAYFREIAVDQLLSDVQLFVTPWTVACQAPNYLPNSALHNAGGCNSAHSAAERSYPTSEVRGRSREDPMPEGRRPRGVTPRPRSGPVAESARLHRHRNSREELPHFRGQGLRRRGATPRGRSGRQPRVPGCDSAGAGERSYPTSKVRSGSQEELPHIQGAVAARA